MAEQVIAGTEAPAAEPAPTETNLSEVQGDFSIDALVDMIHHDPIAEAQNEAPQAAEADGGAGQEGGEQTPAVNDPPEPASMGEPETPPVQVAQTQNAVPDVNPVITPEALQHAVAQGVREASAPEQGEQTPAGPDFSTINIPAPVLAAMEHEDAAIRAQGYQAFAGGIGNLVYQQAVAQMQEMAKVVESNVPQYIQEQAAAQAEQNHVEQDFYGTFPQYNVAELKPVVLQVALQEQQRLGITNWTTELRDAVGARMATILGANAAEPAAVTPPAAPAPAAALTMQKAGTRPTTHEIPATDDPNSLFYGAR